MEPQIAIGKIKFLWIRGTFFFYFLFFCYGKVSAISCLNPDTSGSFMVKFSLGVEGFNLSPLNHALISAGFQNVFRKPEMFGSAEFDLGTLIQKSSVFLSFSFTGSAYSNSQKGIQLYAMELATIESINYILLRKNRNYLYPSLGFGWNTVQLNYSNSAQSPGSFQDALATFKGERTLSSGFMPFIVPGISYAWSTDKANDFFIGIGISYELGIGRKSWESGGNFPLKDSPETKVQSWNLNAFISFM